MFIRDLVKSRAHVDRYRTEARLRFSLSLVKEVVGAWGFEHQTPTVPIRFPAPRKTRNAFLQRNFLTKRLEKSPYAAKIA